MYPLTIIHENVMDCYFKHTKAANAGLALALTHFLEDYFSPTPSSSGSHLITWMVYPKRCFHFDWSVHLPSIPPVQSHGAFFAFLFCSCQRLRRDPETHWKKTCCHTVYVTKNISYHHVITQPRHSHGDHIQRAFFRSSHSSTTSKHG